MSQIIHYPNLKTVIEIENVLKSSGPPLKRIEIKVRLSKKVMHQTLNVALSYLEDRGLIADSHKGVIWLGGKDER